MSKRDKGTETDRIYGKMYKTEHDSNARPIEHTIAYAWLINSLADQPQAQYAAGELIAALSDAGMEPYRLVALIHVLDSFVTQDMPID